MLRSSAAVAMTIVAAAGAAMPTVAAADSGTALQPAITAPALSVATPAVASALRPSSGERVITLDPVFRDDFGPPVAHAAAGSYTIPPTKYGALGLTQQQYKTATYIATGASIALGFVGTALSIFPATAPAGVALRLAGYGAAAVALYFNYQSNNPPTSGHIGRLPGSSTGDTAHAAGAPSYTMVFKPTIVSYPPVTIAAPYAGSAGVVHTLLQSVLHINELGTAFNTSVSRAASARKAGADKYVVIQESAAARYAAQESTLLFGLQGERDAITRTLVAEKFPGRAFTQKQVSAGKAKLISSKEATSTRQALTDLTLGSVAPSLKRAILDYAAQLQTAKSTAAHATTLDAVLGASSSAAQEDKFAGALHGYAVKYGG